MQVDVKRELGEIEAEHRNIRQWAQCADGGDCEKGSQQDLWERRGGGGHQEISSQGSTEVAPRAVSVGGQALASHAPEIERKPYSASEWTDTKPAVSWEHSKPLAIEAGYELSNCMVAAEKDTGVVEVKLIEKVPAIMTEQGECFRHFLPIGTKWDVECLWSFVLVTAVFISALELQHVTVISQFSVKFSVIKHP